MNTPDYISRVLDSGCTGVIAPGVSSAAEARAVVDAAKYAPVGSRGVSGALPVTGFRAIPDLHAEVNAVTTVIVMFESGAALAAAARAGPQHRAAAAPLRFNTKAGLRHAVQKRGVPGRG